MSGGGNQQLQLGTTAARVRLNGARALDSRQVFPLNVHKVPYSKKRAKFLQFIKKSHCARLTKDIDGVASQTTVVARRESVKYITCHRLKSVKQVISSGCFRA